MIIVINYENILKTIGQMPAENLKEMQNEKVRF